MALKMRSDWHLKHWNIIEDFLLFLSKKTKNFVLKGGTALKKCYNLPRMSEDIDLDNINKKERLASIITEFCKINNYKLNLKKDTETTERYMIHYGDLSHPLKVEVSYRNKNSLLVKELSLVKNGVLTYNINTLFGMKTDAYSNRDKIRDLYDLSFIINNYYDELSSENIIRFEDTLDRKDGLDQLEYVIRTDIGDNLVNRDELETMFLKMYEKIKDKKDLDRER